LLLTLFACRDEKLPPAGQVRLHVMTDAILPLRAGEAALDNSVLTPPPLFDRLRIDLFRPGEREPCAGCSRELEIDETTVNEGRASIGLTPRPGVAGYRARVRIYRARSAPSSDPPTHVVIEQVVALPVVAEEGIVDATVTLRTDDLGKPKGTLEQPNPVEPGRPQSKLAGTWPAAKRVDCKDPPPPGEVCVPGGAFWMGDPSTLSGSQYSDDPQRFKLVVVSPFYMDSTEVTVREMRASGVALPDSVAVTVVLPGGGTFDLPGDPMLLSPLYTADIAPYHWCNYRTDADGATRDGVLLDDLPVNCVTQPRALSYCQAKGADLPSEAQFEYVAGGLESRPFVWGGDDPSCSDAVWGRAGVGRLRVLWANCRADKAEGGALPPRSGARDQLTLPTGTIYDILGNVVEWSKDTWARSTEACWSFSLAKDPVCTTPSPTTLNRFTLRGGAWGYPGLTLRATFRQESAGIENFGAFAGFRCARAAVAK